MHLINCEEYAKRQSKQSVLMSRIASGVPSIASFHDES